MCHPPLPLTLQHLKLVKTTNSLRQQVIISNTLDSNYIVNCSIDEVRLDTHVSLN